MFYDYYEKLEKIEVLIGQKRYAQAGNILQDLLTKDPNDALVLYYLSVVQKAKGNFEEAEETIDRSLHLAPGEVDFLLWKATLLLEKEKYKDFEKIMKNVLSIDPENDEAFALLASEKLDLKKFQQALDYASKALEINPENLFALNLRSKALLKLKRDDESDQNIEDALQIDPNDPFTHTNYGYNLLEQGKHDEALEAFKLALQIKPDFDYAQQGILMALRAKNPFYRAFLKYAFWISNFSEKYQWFIIIGFYLLYRFIIKLSDKYPEYSFILIPAFVIMGLFMFSTWIVTPLSNLFLRFNPYGKLLLSKNEIKSSNLVSLSLFVGLVSLILYFVLHDEYYISLAFFGFTMMIPFSVMFRPEKKRNLMLVYTLVLLVLGVLAVVTHVQTGEIMNGFAVKYLIGLFVFQWVANYLMMKE